MPIVRPLSKSTFTDWLHYKGKLGGQNKVPRLCNDRKYVEDILQFCAEKSEKKPKADIF